MAGVMLASVVTTLAAGDKWWGYTGPGNGSAGAFPDVPVITIKQAKTMRDDAFVALEGRIERAVKKDLYILTDGEDSITVEIDKHLWYGLTVAQMIRCLSTASWTGISAAS